MTQSNPQNLPVIDRNIASIVVFSADGKVLMGRKAANGGGVYSDRWHIPGGGQEEGETLASAAARELSEEVVGLSDAIGDMEFLAGLSGSGATEKVLDDGGRVWCEMKFNYFRLTLREKAADISKKLRPSSDFVELRFFSPDELRELPTVPGGVEAKLASGELTPVSKSE